MHRVCTALVMNGRVRESFLDQLDTPPIENRVVRAGRDEDSPPEMMRDSDVHAPSLPRAAVRPENSWIRG